jgi:hypothetical protein
MPILAWRNDADGFAFVNSFTFDTAERGALTNVVQPLVLPVVAAVGAVVHDPVTLTVVGVAAQNYTVLGPLPTYALCSGMAYVSVDYWHAKAPLPRGAHANDQPDRTAAASATLRQLIWQRLLDSFGVGIGGGGVFHRAMEWTLLLNQVPEFLGGGPRALLERTKEEWTIVKAHINAGRPWPICLIYTDSAVWEQHMVVAYGYEDHGDGTGRLYVYDCNTPHQYGQRDRHSANHCEHPSVITLGFRGDALSGSSPTDKVVWSSDCRDRTQLNTLAGFFCSNYVPAVPPAGLATSYGQFLSWTGDSRTWMVADGARMPIADLAELTALGAAAADVRPTGAAAPPISMRPRDGSLLRERSAAAVFLYAGGAPFWVPDPTWLDRFGGWGAVRTVPDGTLGAFDGVPDEGTLLREWSDVKVYRIQSGQRCWVTTPSELAKHGGFPTVRVVPDGALASIPVGPDLPVGGPTTVPEVTELSRANARSAVVAADLLPAFTGPTGQNAWVLSQAPQAGSTVPRGSTVRMQTSTNHRP